MKGRFWIAATGCSRVRRLRSPRVVFRHGGSRMCNSQLILSEPNATTSSRPHGTAICTVLCRLSGFLRHDVYLTDDEERLGRRHLHCGLPVGRIDGHFAVKQRSNNVAYVTGDPGIGTVPAIEIKRDVSL